MAQLRRLARLVPPPAICACRCPIRYRFEDGLRCGVWHPNSLKSLTLVEAISNPHPPALHQQRSQAHSADSPHGEGEQMQFSGKHLSKIWSPPLNAALPWQDYNPILEQKFLSVNGIWFGFSNIFKYSY